MITVLWKRVDGSGMDRCLFTTTANGMRIAGTSLGLVAGHSYEIRYSILTDPEWRTLTVGAHAQTVAEDRGLALRADGAGRWSAGDEPVLDLYGAIDAALAWSPAAHTLPLRRLTLEVGQVVEVPVALVTYPERTVRRVIRSYERLGPGAYRCTAEGSDTVLEVDTNTVVTAIPGVWLTVDGTLDDR